MLDVVDTACRGRGDFNKFISFYRRKLCIQPTVHKSLKSTKRSSSFFATDTSYVS